MKKIKKNKKPLIFLTAGGTGGHVYPAEALAEELLRRGYDVALVTDSRGKNNYNGKLSEIPNYAVLGGALVGKSRWFKIKSLIKTGIGVLQAGYLLLTKRPVCVVGFGGYASFPCAMAAIVLGRDLVIHEQNSVMSRTNRFLSKYASLIAQSFKKVKFTPQNIKTVLTGMPIRQSIIEVRDHAYPPLDGEHKMQIMVLGGSQGAKVFGEVIPEAVKSLRSEIQESLKICQQCRKEDVEIIEKAYQDCRAEIVLSPFFNNMPELYSGTHLIFSRAGASSVCEIAAVGIPSVLVPLPIAADDHQTYNAMEISDVRGGIVLKQQDFTVEKVKSLIETLLGDYEALQQMANNTKKAGITDAASRFADAIEKEILK